MNHCKSFRIKEELKKEFLSQENRCGKKAPTVRALANRFAISTATSRKILQMLAEENILSSRSRSGYFVKENTVPRILFVWNSAFPDMKNNPTGTLSCRYIHEYFRKNGFACDFIYGSSFREQPEKIIKKMKKYDGILFSMREDDFSFNEMAIEKLNCVEKKIVCFRYESILPSLHHSHVIPDLSTAFSHLAKKADLKNLYSCFVIVSAYDEQARLREKFLKDFLLSQGILEENIEICTIHSTTYTRSYLAANVFRQKAASYPQNTLFLPVSYYFSPGLRQVFDSLHKEFDIISMDNQESYISGMKHRYFTAIDMVRPRIGLEAAKLLVRLIREKDDANCILRIPTKLVIRKSTHFIRKGEK